MGETLNGLEQVQIYRPHVHGGELELMVGTPAVRRWPTRLCEGFEIALLIGPSHGTTVQGRQVEAPARIPFIKPPGTVWSAKRAKGAFLSMEIGPDLYVRHLAAWRGRAAAPAQGLFAMPGLLDSFWSAHKVLRSEDDVTVRSEALVGLLATVFEQLTGAPPAHRDPDAASRARDAIHDSPAREITVEALAALSGVTAFELLGAFRQRYGITPARYRQALRVAQARRMLVAGRTIDEVVPALGFRSASDLRRAFLRRVGVGPETFVSGHRSRTA